jgi:hypothetical protein
MDTYQARRRMRDLAQETIEILDDVAARGASRADASVRLKDMEQEARTLLSDAGYPGEPVWRGLQRAQLELRSGSPDAPSVSDAAAEMRESLEALDSLMSPASERESDFRIIG